MSGLRDQTSSRFDSGGTAKMGGHPNASVSIASDIERSTTNSQNSCCSSAAAAARAGLVVRVVGPPVNEVIRFVCHRQLGRVGFPEQNRAGSAQSSHYR